MDTTDLDHQLKTKIQELFYDSIRTYKSSDAISLKALKVNFVGLVVETLGIEWMHGHNLYKTHTYVHPDIAKQLAAAVVGEEEVTSVLAQGFIRNDKLIRMLKTFNQHGLDMNKILAVDGLQINNSFDQKFYIGNLRYGDTKSVFGNGEEFKRLHVQTVRKMYDMLKNEPVHPKQIYEILRTSFEEMTKVKLPETDIDDDELLDEKVQDKCVKFYMRTMGKDNIEKFVKSLKIRGEKRNHHSEEEESSGEKRNKNDK